MNVLILVNVLRPSRAIFLKKTKFKDPLGRFRFRPNLISVFLSFETLIGEIVPLKVKSEINRYKNLSFTWIFPQIYMLCEKAHSYCEIVAINVD